MLGRSALVAFAGLFLPAAEAAPSREFQQATDTAFVFFDAQDTSAIPKRLSQSGLFRDILAKTVNPGVTPFDINSALWSDGAAKIRYLILPGDSQLTYRDDSAYGFPQGTVLVKNFLIDTIQNAPASRIYLETRLLVKQHPDDSITSWYGFSYQWNRDQTDAILVNPATGLETTIPVRTPASQVVQKKWSFPSQGACWRCHMSGAREVLGFHTAQLNRPSAADGSVNQLQAFVDAGMFRGTAFPDFRDSHRWAALTDTSQPLEKRARSYLAANCSFCHGEEGRRVIGTVLSAIQDLDYFSADFPLNYINRPAKFDYGIPGSMLVYGGNPDKSILVYRMGNRAMDKMPPLATAEPDTTALRVVSEWIGTLPPPVQAVVHSRQGMSRHRAWIRGSVLHLDAAGADKSAPHLLDGQGREVPLDGLGGGTFRLPPRSAPGIYFVKLPGESRSLPVPLLP